MVWTTFKCSSPNHEARDEDLNGHCRWLHWTHISEDNDCNIWTINLPLAAGSAIEVDRLPVLIYHPRHFLHIPGAGRQFSNLNQDDAIIFCQDKSHQILDKLSEWRHSPRPLRVPVFIFDDSLDLSEAGPCHQGGSDGHIEFVLMVTTAFYHRKKYDIFKLKIFINKKFWKTFYFFTCILPDYVAHDITKEFWKNSHFENMTAGFLLRCQNWLRYEISLIWHWNIDLLKQNWSFVYVKVPNDDQNVI